MLVSQHLELAESADAPAGGQISGVVDGSVVTSLCPDGTITFHVAIGQELTGDDNRASIEIVLDRVQAQAVLEAWHRRGVSGSTTMLPATRCQVGVQWHPRCAVDR
jgi:hypothetical protein